MDLVSSLGSGAEYTGIWFRHHIAAHAAGKLAGKTKIPSDGYVIVSNVKPGKFQLRIEREQLTGLKLAADRVAEVEVTPQGDFVFGVDFVLSKTKPQP